MHSASASSDLQVQLKPGKSMLKSDSSEGLIGLFKLHQPLCVPGKLSKQTLSGPLYTSVRSLAFTFKLLVLIVALLVVAVAAVGCACCDGVVKAVATHRELNRSTEKAATRSKVLRLIIIVRLENNDRINAAQSLPF